MINTKDKTSKRQVYKRGKKKTTPIKSKILGKKHTLLNKNIPYLKFIKG